MFSGSNLIRICEFLSRFVNKRISAGLHHCALICGNPRLIPIHCQTFRWLLSSRNDLMTLYICGNVHEEDEKRTFYIEGLIPGIRTIVALLREIQPIHDLTFEDFTHFAKGEGYAFPDSAQQYNPSSNTHYFTRLSSSEWNRKEKVNLIAGIQDLE